MKLIYITANFPYSYGETFLLNEIIHLRNNLENIYIIPRGGKNKKINVNSNNQIINDTISLPLLNIKMLVNITWNWRFINLMSHIIKNSSTIRQKIKNIIVLPKSLYLFNLFRNENINHIHVHWGGTTATMAWALSNTTGFPYSITLHRWDIKENNMLKLKAKTACFLRCISESGKKDLIEKIGYEYETKIKVIHMGVRIPKINEDVNKCSRNFVIACPANLLPVKGHKYLIESISILKGKGHNNIKCFIIGDGPLKEKLREQVILNGLNGIINFMGWIPHEKLMKMYENYEVDAVVLPSINTDDGEKEGIPVALMEAMAYGIPCISTNIGGIPELLTDAGIIVTEKNAIALAEAIEKLILDKKFAKELGGRGRVKIEKEFNIETTTKQLLDEISKYVK